MYNWKRFFSISIVTIWLYSKCSKMLEKIRPLQGNLFCFPEGTLESTVAVGHGGQVSKRIKLHDKRDMFWL